MKDLNIDVIREEKVIKPTELEFGSEKYQCNVTVQTAGKQNLTIYTDLLVWAATWKPDTNMYPDDWLNEIGELNVIDTFQIYDQDDVFAIGDVSSIAETKQAITLPGKMKLIEQNILTVAEAIKNGKFQAGVPLKNLKHYRISDKATMYLPIGPDAGVSQLNGWVYGDAKTSKWKGKDLYTNLFWNELTGKNAPTTPDE